MSYLKEIPYENTGIQLSNLELIYFSSLWDEVVKVKWDNGILGSKHF